MLTILARAQRVRGFALLEAIVAIAMLAIIAAAIVPLVAGAEDRLRAEATVRELQHLEVAIDKFREAVSRYPKQLAHLTEPLVVGDANSCGSAYSSDERSKWSDDDVKHGPFFGDHMIVKGFGFATGVGFVRDSTTRSGSNLIISIIDVAEAQALELDFLIDGTGGAGPALGEIRWGAIVDGMTTVEYTLNRSGC